MRAARASGAGAFSSEAGTGSREENATERSPRVLHRFHETVKDASAAGCRRIDRHHDPRQRRSLRHPAGFDSRARPQRVAALLDDLAIQLLAAEQRAAVAADHRVEERHRQVPCIVPRRGARDRGRRIGNQPLEKRDRPRRGRDDLPRPLAKAQPELQHVEGGVGVAPLGEFVAPGGRELRAAQAFGIFGGKRLRHRAILPFQAAARGNPARPLERGMDGEQPGHALDHHLADVVLGLADQRDARLAVAERKLLYPLRPSAGLPCPAAAEKQPRGPIASRRLLVRACEQVPAFVQRIRVAGIKALQKPDPVARRQAPPACAKASGEIRPCL